MTEPLATSWIVEVIAEFSSAEEAAARAQAARLLRHAADQIERGLDCGGFYFSEADNHHGAFALLSKDLRNLL